MLRNLRYPVALLVIALSFMAGAATANVREWLQPAVRVVVHNNTGQSIVSAQVRVKSGEITNVALIDTLPMHDQRVLYFHAQGQSTLTVEARLDNGQILKSGNSYLEPGVAITSHVEPARIRGEYQGRM